MGLCQSKSSAVEETTEIPFIPSNPDIEKTFFEYTTLPNGDLASAQHPLVLYCRRGWDEHVGRLLHNYSLVTISDTNFAQVQQLVSDTSNELNSLRRALGCFLGLVVGDAIGAPLEFHAVRYDVITVRDMGKGRQGKFKLQPGQWTDDSSMALCLADSLLVRGQFDPIDSMLRYLAWWQFGYNNSCVYDRSDPWQHSVGVGSNISDAMQAFTYGAARAKTQSGDKSTSGNGSVMRLAPISIWYRENLEAGLEAARASSLVTHQGEESAECCRLLAFCCIMMISDRITDHKQLLGDLVACGFRSPVRSVMYLAASRGEPDGKDLSDLSEIALLPQDDKVNPNRNWDWKDPKFRYSPERAAWQGGTYVGSYCMDAMAMALHCIWHTNSFPEAMLKAVNTCGDADTLGAVVGQLAGAIYGLSAIPPPWLQAVQKWDRGGLIALRAYKLFHRITFARN